MYTRLPGEEEPSDLRTLLDVRPDSSSPTTFHSVSKAVRVGNLRAMAYGGYVQGLAINAAARTVTKPTKGAPDYGLHSWHGVFLGPCYTTEHIVLRVAEVRSTRTFQTRHVTASQMSVDGKQRDIFFAVCDFHKSEPDGLVFGTRPKLKWLGVDQCADSQQVAQQRLERGEISQRLFDAFGSSFGIFMLLVDRREHPDAVIFQNMSGVDKARATTQDGLHITQKASGWWWKSKVSYEGEPTGSAAHRAALAFLMDAATAFVPLAHSYRFFEDTTACSSLDVSIRWACGEFRIDEWVYCEVSCEAGGESRSIPRVRAWRADGRLIAVGQQNGILRMKDDALAQPKI